jgi:hypothetical protein
LDVLKKNESPCKMCWKSGSIWAKMMMFVSITRFLMSCLTFSHGFGMVFVETTSFFSVVSQLCDFWWCFFASSTGLKRSFDLQSIRTTGNKKLIYPKKTCGFV